MGLPTSEQLSKMSVEQLLGLWKLVRQFRAKLEIGGVGCMPASAVKAMTDVVDDRLMHEIANEQRTVSGPGWLKPSTEPPKPKGSGWVEPEKLDLPPGTKYVDQLCDVQDAIDKAELRRRLGGGR